MADRWKGQRETPAISKVWSFHPNVSLSLLVQWKRRRATGRNKYYLCTISENSFSEGDWGFNLIFKRAQPEIFRLQKNDIDFRSFIPRTGRPPTMESTSKKREFDFPNNSSPIVVETLRNVRPRYVLRYQTRRWRWLANFSLLFVAVSWNELSRIKLEENPTKAGNW